MSRACVGVRAVHSKWSRWNRNSQTSGVTQATNWEINVDAGFGAFQTLKCVRARVEIYLAETIIVQAELGAMLRCDFLI